MINAVTWQTIIQLHSSEDTKDKIFTDIFPIVSDACEEFNNTLKNFKLAKSNYLEIAKNYLKINEYENGEFNNLVLIDTISKDMNGYRNIPSYKNFISNSNNFLNFISESYSSRVNIIKYINDIKNLKNNIFKGNKNVKKISDIMENPEEITKYFYFLVQPIIVHRIEYFISDFKNINEEIKNTAFVNLIKLMSDYMIKKDLLDFFLRLFEVSKSVDSFNTRENLNKIEEIDASFYFSAENICDDSLIYLSLEASDEPGGATEKKEEGGFFKLFEKIKNRIAAIPSQLTTLKKKADLFFQKRKNIRLYKRVLGKIPSLYERYAGETQIDENIMKGDPVEILTTTATEYIINLGKHTGEISDKLITMMNNVANATNFETIKAQIESWIEDSPLKTKDGELSESKDKLSVRLRKATRAKLVEGIINNNQIYGYTPESMVLKKFPPPNHTIVSLFVENPFEKPHVQNVSDIFKSAESFEIMANSDKRNIFQISELQTAVLKNKITAETFKEIERKRKASMRKLKKNGFVETENDDDKLKKENEKMLKEALEGCKLSAKEIGQMKIYVMDCINVYFSMVIRIDNLALACINAMLMTEKQASDDQYDMKQGNALKGKDPDGKGLSKFSEAHRVKKKVDKRVDTYKQNYEN